MSNYAPDRYWGRLLNTHPDERGVAYPELPRSFNRAMYTALTASVHEALADHRVVSPGRVLDIGAGTGIWTAYWLQAGATQVTAVDLVQEAVASLASRFPQVSAIQGDIGADTPPVGGTFDVISAMSILLHITDDERWRQAWVNIADLLHDGGVAVLIEPLLEHEWWGPPFSAAGNSRARPLVEYQTAIRDAGLELVEVRPATVLLANPIDSRSAKRFRMMSRAWRLLSRTIQGRERLGRSIGGLLVRLDTPLRHGVAFGPSAKVVIVRHSGTYS